MYLRAREDWDQIPTTSQLRKLTQSGYGFGPALEGFGQPTPPTQPAGPVFDIQCPNPPGCPPVAAGQCIAVLRQAIFEAIKLANGAAIKIDVATKIEPGKRDAETRETARLFKFFFGHDPTHLVPWARNEASGISVAKRFRAIARELGGGRRIVFRCLDSRPGCADADLTCCPPTANAWVNQEKAPNVMHLCALFWNPPAGLRGLPPPYYRAGVIIHEMLHMLFRDIFRHGGPPGRPNTHCYEAFALRVAGFGADPTDVSKCANLGGWGGFGQLAPRRPHISPNTDSVIGFGLGDVDPIQKSLATIRSLLERSPRTGYAKGSQARRQLEEAFNSVPLASAAKIFVELETGKGPVGKLFRSKLKATEQKEMLEILNKKVFENKRQEEEKLRMEAEKARQLEQARRKQQEEMRRKQGQAEATELCKKLEQLHKESEEAVDAMMKAGSGRNPDWEAVSRNRMKMKRAEREIASVVKRILELGFVCRIGKGVEWAPR
jgi:hypothetical protein